MARSFATPPSGPSYALRDLRAPACLVEGNPGPAGSGGLLAIDLMVEHGRITAIEPAGTMPPEAGPSFGGSLVWPGLIDVHSHLDKGHIWNRTPNPDGSHHGAVGAVMADRTAHWTAEDVRRRMEFGLQTAYAHGVVAIRTHLDSLAPQAAISWPVFRAMRDAWAGRIALQATSLMNVEAFLTEQGPVLADIVADSGGNLGFGTRLSGPGPVPPEFDAAIDRVFALAGERGLDLDLHVDESGDDGARALIRIARQAVRRGFRHRILCGHCCALAVQPPEFVTETLVACADAGIGIVSLPTVNLYLQDRHAGRTPRWRGVTVLHEMRSAGLRVAVAGDNVRDPFYAYGDHDVLDTFVQAAKILHLDHPFGDWPAAVAATPAAMMGLDGLGLLRRGVVADLLILKARSYGEMLARSQSDRVVIRGGRAIDTTPPDYALLDDEQPTLFAAG